MRAIGVDAGSNQVVDIRDIYRPDGPVQHLSFEQGGQSAQKPPHRLQGTKLPSIFFAWRNLNWHLSSQSAPFGGDQNRRRDFYNQSFHSMVAFAPSFFDHVMPSIR
ncbi:hypothetical protein SBA_ch1_36170 [Sphingomonas bisphenolicum]|uniref:Uncharacterized protein n=1 Tax=Sphingomonas bisphenolicum TaxID=296544 RepID=A0ABM7G282_9SPHN|nr:hypothetical protein SBA_ch1_36170 [Sphingomonas bisphenolicum]